MQVAMVGAASSDDVTADDLDQVEIAATGNHNDRPSAEAHRSPRQA